MKRKIYRRLEEEKKSMTAITAEEGRGVTRQALSRHSLRKDMQQYEK